MTNAGRPLWRRILPLRALMVLATLALFAGFVVPRFMGPDGWLDSGARDVGFVLSGWQFRGHTRTSEKALTARLDLEIGQSIMAIDLEALAIRLETLPWVAHVDIVRQLPGTLEISVLEREPFALWQREGRVSLIDEGGAVIGGVALDAFGHLPLLVGAGADKRGTQLFAMLSRAPTLLARLETAVWVGGRRWDLLLDNGMRIKLPERVAEGFGAEEALDMFVELNRKYSIMQREIEVVDMRNPETLTVRLTKEGRKRMDRDALAI